MRVHPNERRLLFPIPMMVKMNLIGLPKKWAYQQDEPEFVESKPAAAPARARSKQDSDRSD